METEIENLLSSIIDRVVRSIGNENIKAERKNTSLKAKTSGIGLLLGNLRNSSDPSTSGIEDEHPITKKAKTDDINSQTIDRPLNRKERRALKQAELKEKYETNKEASISQEPPVITKKAVPPKLKLVHCEEASFQNYKASFGYTGTQTNNYVRFCHISPSSKYAVTASQDRYIRLYDIGDNLSNPKWKHNMGGLIYDVVWINNKNGNNTELIATTSKDHPIHVWNCENGEMVGAYIGRDYADAVDSAFCVQSVGNLLVGGYKKEFKIWNIQRGGKPITTIPFFDHTSKNGLVGRAMSIDGNPQMDRIFAAVGCSDRVCIYSEQWKSPISTIIGSSNGYTHVKYSQDSNKLYASERKGNIHVFDLRMNMLIQVLKREFNTNHRSVFHIDFENRLLYSGTSSGEIVSYDIDSYEEEVEPFSKTRVSSTCIPCVSSSHSKLVICSGERIFPRLDLIDSEEENENSLECVTLYPSNSFQLFDISF